MWTFLYNQKITMYISFKKVVGETENRNTSKQN